MQVTAHRFVSVEDYLEGELRSEVKHEYIGGDVYAMAGVSTLPTLQEYLVVSPHEAAATLFRRSHNWQAEALGPGATLSLPALNQFSAPIATLFAGVTFSPRG